MLKKILKPILAAFMSISLLACSSKEPELNAERGTNYKYDFMQFLDAQLYGPDGHGFLVIQPKEIQVSDFESEDEYISVKKAVDGLKLYYDPDQPNQNSYITLSAGEELSNGDVITIGISSEYDNSAASEVGINLESYEFEIHDLKEAKSLDIFDSTSLALLALDDGTNNIYPVKIYGGELSDEILDQISYKATSQDSKPKAGQTIVDVSADIIPLVDEDNNPLSTSLASWLYMQGYVAQTSAEKVVREIATPITFTENNKKIAKELLYTTLKNDDDLFLSLANIQQVNASENSYNPYVYTVTYYASSTDSNAKETTATACKKATVQMAYSEAAGVSVLELKQSGSRTNTEYCTSAYDEMTVQAQYANTVDTIDTAEQTQEIETPDVQTVEN